MTANSHQIGSARITRICEMELASLSPKQVFPDLPEEAASDPALFPRLTLTNDGNLRISVHSWLVDTGSRRILIDTGAGARKHRPYAPYFQGLQTPFLENLAAAGVRPEDIDLVLLTHLHVDHVGWNTRLRDGAWIPTFPNAEYVFSQDEYRFFGQPGNQTERHRTSFMARQDSVDPVVAAGQARMIHIDGSEQLPNFYFLPTPGHSPFHSSILLDAGQATALFFGDLMHHPFQIVMPEINSVFDADPDACRQARRYALELAAKPNTTVFSAHFAASSALKIEKQQGGYAWRFCPGAES